MKKPIILAVAFVAMAACTPKQPGGVADDIGTDTTGTDGTDDGCPETTTGEDPDPDCATPYITTTPPAVDVLPIASDELHRLPTGGWLRVVRRVGATRTVLVFAGMSGSWSSASAYIQDAPAIMTGVDLAIVEMVNPYGVGNDTPRLDPDLFMPFDAQEQSFSTWGWTSWIEGGDEYDPATPGAYPVLIATGDVIENAVGDVDVFVQLGKEAGGRLYPCGGGAPYNCNGHSIMAWGSEASFDLASNLAAALGQLEPDWGAWSQQHPLGNGYIYDDPAEGADRLLGTAADWALQEWPDALAVEVIFPSNAPIDRCAPLLMGEPTPPPWAANADELRQRSHTERAASVATALLALNDLLAE